MFGIYVETLANHVENYTDNLVLYMLDDSVGSVIDNYIKYYNDLHDNLLELFDPYMSFESKEMIMNIRQARNNVDDNDNLYLQ